MNLTGKTIVLGVTGGIAAYKAAEIASALNKTGAEIHVIMTKNACEFVSPLTFETLTGHRVSVDTFDRNFEWNVQHVALAKKADLFVIAPATANIIAKMANGIADDMLSTTVMAARCHKMVAPAMNTGMYDNPATQRNLDTLERDGVELIEPGVGRLACGDVGAGRLADVETILERIYQVVAFPKDLAGLHITVTAGPTCERIDPVRFITNHSSGKMGFAIANAAKMRGASVTLIAGPNNLKVPYGVDYVQVFSAQEMFDAVLQHQQESHIMIKAAAVGDYRPASTSEQKIKKTQGELTLRLVKNPDILKALGEQKKPGQILCGFAMETENLLENARKKLKDKHADMIVANSLREEGAGFAGDTNIVTLITEQDTEKLSLMSKDEVAHEILNRLAAML